MGYKLNEANACAEALALAKINLEKCTEWVCAEQVIDFIEEMQSYFISGSADE